MTEEDPAMVLWPRIEELRDHYREFLPKAYKELQGHVLQDLAQNMQHGELVAIENGYQPHEAREIVNDTWLPRPEDETESEALPVQRKRALVTQPVPPLSRTHLRPATKTRVYSAECVRR